MNPVAKKIREARLKAGMSEKELARKCGVAASYIQQVESGKKIIQESLAESILKVFGEKLEDPYDSFVDEKPKTAVKPSPVPSASVRKVTEASKTPVSEPSEQWAGALAGIIKSFPVIDVATGKTVLEKELPVLSKKIEGIPAEKLRFYRVSDDLMEGMRIRKDDVLWVQEMKTLQEDGLYLLRWQGKIVLYRVQKKDGGLVLSRSTSGLKATTVSSAEVEILGRCMRVEFKTV